MIYHHHHRLHYQNYLHNIQYINIFIRYFSVGTLQWNRIELFVCTYRGIKRGGVIIDNRILFIRFKTNNHQLTTLSEEDCD